MTEFEKYAIRGRGILSGLPWQWGKGPAGWMCGLQGKHITVKDVTLMSSWTWMLVFNEAEDVLVDNIKLLNGRTLNDDGIDMPQEAPQVGQQDIFQILRRILVSKRKRNQPKCLA